MSNYEKEMEEAFEESCIRLSEAGELRLLKRNMTIYEVFEEGAKWQASRVTEEKILEVLNTRASVYERVQLVEHCCYEDIFSHVGDLPEDQFKYVAKEIIALIKGEE